jgi:hypothetical protein
MRCPVKTAATCLEIMKKQLVGYKGMVGVLLGGLLAFGAPAQEAANGANSSSVGAAKHSTGVDEILAMMQAGVSPQVLKTYVESSPIPYNLNAADIVALKQQGVPDDLTTVILRRGAEVRGQRAEGGGQRSEVRGQRSEEAASAYQAGNGRYKTLDPEGYDYFQYYYLYPRTLEAANERLFSSYRAFGNATPFQYQYGGYGIYGIYGPATFYPAPPAAFGHP